MRLTTDRTIVLKDRRNLGFAEYDDPQGIPMLLFHGAPGTRLEGALFDRAAQAHRADPRCRSSRLCNLFSYTP